MKLFDTDMHASGVGLLKGAFACWTAVILALAGFLGVRLLCTLLGKLMVWNAAGNVPPSSDLHRYSHRGLSVLPFTEEPFLGSRHSDGGAWDQVHAFKGPLGRVHVD